MFMFPPTINYQLYCFTIFFKYVRVLQENTKSSTLIEDRNQMKEPTLVLESVWKIN